MYIQHTYYSKQGTSDGEHFKMASNYGYGKGTAAQSMPIPPVRPPKKPR